MDELRPPPVRRLDLEDPVPAREIPAPSTNGHGRDPDPSGASAQPATAPQFAHRRIGTPQVSIPRMEVEQVTIRYGQRYWR